MNNYYNLDGKPRKPFEVPGASQQLRKDIKNSIEEGCTYGVYMGRKRDREDEAYYKKYGKKRLRK